MYFLSSGVKGLNTCPQNEWPQRDRETTFNEDAMEGVRRGWGGGSLEGVRWGWGGGL